MNTREGYPRFLSSPRCRWMGAVGCVIAGLFLFSCSQKKQEVKAELAYPAPRYPRYLVQTKTEDLMKAARFAVRQPSGRNPLGKMKPGQSVYVFTQWGQDDNVWNAVQAAWKEMGVDAHRVGYWEAMGITKEEYDRRCKENAVFGNDAWKELGNFDSSYKPFFPPEEQKQFGNPITNEFLREVPVPAYLDKHPEIQHVFAGTGGDIFWVNAFGKKHSKKFEGNWAYLRPVDLLSKAAEFPSDVWNLIDEKILRPIPFVSEITFQDPEGTNLHWTVTPEEARTWSHSTGTSNHIYIYPNPVRSTLQEGAVLVAHGNHTGVYPTMTVHLDNHGGIQSIDGGGRVGELFRTLVSQPAFKEAKFPTSPIAGYWFFRQDGFATNPKFVRSLPAMVEGEQQMSNLSERNRAGIQHLAFSYDSNDPEDLAYAKQHGLPLGKGQHTAHMHNYFPTVKWKLRDTGEWVTIADKSSVKMFDDPEVRALAARYGEPDLIFRYEWIPSMPGINVPGDYKTEFAPDPWKWILAEWKQIEAGTYKYFVDDYSMTPKQVAENAGHP